MLDHNIRWLLSMIVKKDIGLFCAHSGKLIAQLSACVASKADFKPTQIHCNPLGSRLQLNFSRLIINTLSSVFPLIEYGSWHLYINLN